MYLIAGKRAKAEDGGLMMRDEKITDLKDDVTAKLVIVKQCGSLSVVGWLCRRGSLDRNRVGLSLRKTDGARALVHYPGDGLPRGAALLEQVPR